MNETYGIFLWAMVLTEHRIIELGNSLKLQSTEESMSHHDLFLI